jgi:hypothetical protein
VLDRKVPSVDSPGRNPDASGRRHLAGELDDDLIVLGEPAAARVDRIAAWRQVA